MARPRKQDSERRCCSIRADLTLAEKSYIRRQVEKTGLSEAEYSRRRLLGYVVPPRSEQQDFAALISEINALGNQISAAGNLANQIALACHTNRRLPNGWDVLPNDYRDLKRRVELILEKVILQHGSKIIG